MIMTALFVQENKESRYPCTDLDGPLWLQMLEAPGISRQSAQEKLSFSVGRR